MPGAEPGCGPFVTPGATRQPAEDADQAAKMFYLSHNIPEKWNSADIRQKRKLLETLCLN